jgi:RNA ligase (TIGR02306 family)
MELTETADNSFWKVARMLDIENKLRSTGYNIAIQGELMGEGIQGNKLKLKGQTVYFFNAFNIDSFKYMDYVDFTSLMKAVGLPVVPVIDDKYKLSNDIEQIIKSATIKSKIKEDVWAEGIVIRPHAERIDMLLSCENFNNGRVTFKAINPEFLLKYE